jgi:hypothetical protein
MMNDDAPDTQPPPPDPVLATLEGILHEVGELRGAIDDQAATITAQGRRLGKLAKALSDVVVEVQRVRTTAANLDSRVVPLERHFTPAAGMGAVRP